MNTTTAIKLVDVVSAAKMLGIQPRQIERMARRGEIPHFALPGGLVQFDPAELVQWVEARHHRAGEVASCQ